MNNTTTPRDFFVHIGATVALYASVIAIINLSMSVIDYLLPDVLAGYFYSNSVAWPISMLVVLVPLLYILEGVIAKDIKHDPNKANILIARWRTYLTLFLTGATILVDLIVLINVYLNGEVSARFIWKVLAVIVIAGIVFAYYFLSRKVVNPNIIFWQRILYVAGIVVVLGGIVTGFVVVGSPADQLAYRLDNQRVSDLQNLQWQIISYWQNKNVLPQSLDDLNNPLTGYVIPVDPTNKALYGYTIKDAKKLTFELCATFDRSYRDLEGRGSGGIGMSRPVYYDVYGPAGENWKHDAGSACFERTIDPDLYPKPQKFI